MVPIDVHLKFVFNMEEMLLFDYKHRLFEHCALNQAQQRRYWAFDFGWTIEECTEQLVMRLRDIFNHICQYNRDKKFVYDEHSSVFGAQLNSIIGSIEHAEKNLLQHNARGHSGVIDVGGGFIEHTSSTSLIDAVLYHSSEFFSLQGRGIRDQLKNIKNFDGDLCTSTGWEAVLKHVATFGKFSFGICFQTLEFSSRPLFVLSMLSAIADVGMIVTRSKFSLNVANENLI